MALAIALTLTRNWNAWEGGRVDQVTDDAFVRRDVTPLGTKVVGLVREVKVSDYQQVRKGDELVRLEDEDYRAGVAQATAAVDAARAALENNRRQRDLQDARIQRAVAGIDQAQAQIAAARAGTEAVQADVSRTNAERSRQEALFSTGSATKQRVESAVADAERFSAQLASREADLEQEAGLAVAQVNLNYTRIIAPADGAVGERQVRPGQLVSPGTQVLSFVDGTVWVQANFRETQLRNITVGDPVEVRIDVYPGEVMRGQVLEISPASGSQFALLPPDNATGNFTKVVQRVPVKVALDGLTPATWLRSGLSAVVTVRTKSQASR
jgi:membrane fusion protein (multidrug efflux system)